MLCELASGGKNIYKEMPSEGERAFPDVWGPLSICLHIIFNMGEKKANSKWKFFAPPFW